MSLHRGYALECLQATGINAKVVTNTSLGLTESDGSRRFITMAIHFMCENAAGITVGPIVSIGWTGATYTDLLPASVLNITAANTVVAVTPTAPTGLVFAPYASIPPNTEVFARISTAAIGTSQTLTARVWGAYV